MATFRLAVPARAKAARIRVRLCVCTREARFYNLLDYQMGYEPMGHGSNPSSTTNLSLAHPCQSVPGRDFSEGNWLLSTKRNFPHLCLVETQCDPKSLIRVHARVRRVLSAEVSNS